jgi:hypothetical protein
MGEMISRFFSATKEDFPTPTVALIPLGKNSLNNDSPTDIEVARMRDIRIAQ